MSGEPEDAEDWDLGKFEAEIAAIVAAPRKRRRMPATIREWMGREGHAPLTFPPIEPGVMVMETPLWRELLAFVAFMRGKKFGLPFGLSYLPATAYQRKWSKTPLQGKDFEKVALNGRTAARLYDWHGLPERYRRQAELQAARDRRTRKNREMDLQEADYLEDDDGLVHYRPPHIAWHGWKTLCGHHFDEDTGQREKGGPFKPAGRRFVTCPDCAMLISLTKGAKVDKAKVEDVRAAMAPKPDDEIAF